MTRAAFVTDPGDPNYGRPDWEYPRNFGGGSAHAVSGDKPDPTAPQRGPMGFHIPGRRPRVTMRFVAELLPDNMPMVG